MRSSGLLWVTMSSANIRTQKDTQELIKKRRSLLIKAPYFSAQAPNYLSEGVRFGDLSQDEKAEFT